MSKWWKSSFIVLDQRRVYVIFCQFFLMYATEKILGGAPVSHSLHALNRGLV